MLFETLELLFDGDAPGVFGGPPFGAAVNMAVDEVLLTHACRPILRVYGWARSAVTFGYFESWASVAARFSPGEWELVRRWTGGGVVPHGEDWTYSVIVPRSDPFSRVGAGESYRVLHERLALAMRSSGVGDCPALVDEAAAKSSNACFENPARFDVLAKGHKIAGAAQRRSRFGMLHQGSVQNVSVPPGFAQRLAESLGTEITARVLSAAERREAEELALGKYGTEAWNRRY